jgi:hypothetical protein
MVILSREGWQGMGVFIGFGACGKGRQGKQGISFKCLEETLPA